MKPYKPLSHAPLYNIPNILEGLKTSLRASKSILGLYVYYRISQYEIHSQFKLQTQKAQINLLPPPGEQTCLIEGFL